MILCLVFTSIPCVLLMAPHIINITGPLEGGGGFAWLLLAWSVTLCGNLTMFGSVAGVIAGESAAADEMPISFTDWCSYSIPSTIVITFLGTSILTYTLK